VNAFRLLTRAPSVIRIAIPWVMQSVNNCNVITNMPSSAKFMDVFYQLKVSEQQLSTMYGSIGLFLRISEPKAIQLRVAINKIVNVSEAEPTATVDLWDVKIAAIELHPVLLAEINVLPSFLVGERGVRC
jgi:hypothetical protein